MEFQKHQYIDSLRGIAILLVLLVHNLYVGNSISFLPKVFIDIIEYGQLGVQLFFIVSAYTLMSSYYSRNNDVNATRNFFIRRIFRIVPMYYIAIFYFSFQNYIGFQYYSTHHVLQHLSLGNVLANFSFLHGFNPYWMNTLVPGGWSIAVEMTFYLSLPFICRRVKNTNDALVLMMGSLVISAILEQVFRLTPLRTNEYLYYWFPNQLPIFSLGILAFFIRKEGFQKPTMIVWVMACYTAITFFFIPPPHHFIVGLGFTLLLLLLAKFPLKIFVNKISAGIGKVSYSMYFVHFAVMYWMTHSNLGAIIKINSAGSAFYAFAFGYVVLFSASFLISTLTYRYVELKFQNYGAALISALNSGMPFQQSLKSLFFKRTSAL